MKENKFRAWDKHLKAYREVDILAWPLNYEQFEFQQYTGLKDKNGKEIYHKDQMKHPEGRFKFTVEWKGYKWILVDENGVEGEDFGKVHDKYEIIGNIYEN